MPTTLAFDPGLSITGYACVERAAGGTLALIEAGSIDLTGPVGAEAESEAERWGPRLVELGRDITAIIERLRPDGAAIEAVFAHREHPRAAIAMAHARGVILRELASASLTTTELAPATIKKSLTGNGRASKDQVARAVALRLNLPALPEPRDVSDAVAIALAACDRAASPTLT